MATKKSDLPGAWSNKDKDKYEHIKEGYVERGTPERRAKRIAGQTVNKGRKEEGRTKGQKSSGSSSRSSSSGSSRGSSSSRSAGLEDKSKGELYDMAKRKDIDGRSKMDKKQLVRALQKT